MSGGIDVSVIVLSYNHERYITQALDSILMQKTDYRYEILIGDDCSQDRTAEILKEYQRKYPDVIRLFLWEKNLGAARNSYELLTRAKGRYLATCEGDDYWTDPKKLQIQVDFLEKNPAYVGVTHHFTIVNEMGAAVRKQRLDWVKPRAHFTMKDFQGVYLPGQPSTFVRRNIFLDTSQDYSAIYRLHPMIADRTLMLLFLSRGTFCTLQRNMSCYRQSTAASSLTTALYANSPDHVWLDYTYNESLERYATELTGRTVVYRERRKILFADALVMIVRQPMRRNNWTLVGRMLRKSEAPFFLLVSAPYYIAKKIIKIIKNE